VAGAGAAAVDAAVSSAGSIGAAGLALVAPSLGSQGRNGFRCIMESIKQKFTLFSPDGVPLRATLTVALREYKTLDDQLAKIPTASPDRTHAHVLGQTDSLSSVAQLYYDSSAEWRAIADRNGIDDPRRLSIGQMLEVPRIR
jgi:nucleoid-associated protein YgaU